MSRAAEGRRRPISGAPGPVPAEEPARGRPGKYIEDLVTLPHDLALARRRGGWPDVLRQLALRSLYRVVRVGSWRVVEVDLEIFRGRTRPAGIRFERIGPESWSDFAPLIPRKERPWYRDHDPERRILIAAFRDRTPLGYLWVAWDGADESAARGLPLPPDVAYLSYLFVHRRERRLAIASGLLTAGAERAKERGFERVWMLIRGDDERTLAVARRVTSGHAKLRGRWRYLKLGPRVFGRCELHDPVPIGRVGGADRGSG